jgi:hypothetical protein
MKNCDSSHIQRFQKKHLIISKELECSRFKIIRLIQPMYKVLTASVRISDGMSAFPIFKQDFCKEIICPAVLDITGERFNRNCG